MKLRNVGRWVKNNNIIALKNGRTWDEMTHTVRHEIVHTIHQNHGPQFKLALKGLERGRAIEESMGIKAEAPVQEAST